MGVRVDLQTSLRTLFLANANILAAVGDWGVEIRDHPWLKEKIHRGLTIHWPQDESELAGQNKSDTFVYPVMLTFVQGRREDDNNIDLFREGVKAVVHNKRLADDSKVLRMRWIPGRVALPDHFRKEYVASVGAVSIQRREGRT